MDRLKHFEELCMRHHTLLMEEFDAGAANEVYREIEKLAARMHREGIHQQLEELFEHKHYNVRYLAAALSLLKNEEKALEALEALFEDADPHYSRNAMHTLMAWQQGKMQDYQRHLFDGE